MFRGLAYKTQDRLKAWRARRLRHWIATVNISTDGIEFDLSAPPDSALEDEVTVDLTRRSARYAKTVEEPGRRSVALVNQNQTLLFGNALAAGRTTEASVGQLSSSRMPLFPV